MRRRLLALGLPLWWTAGRAGAFAATAAAPPSAPAAPPVSGDSLDAFIRDALPRVGVPGLAAARLGPGRAPTLRGYGLADIETARAVDADTIFHVASVSKIVTATVAMMLWEDGAFRLDDAVAPHLGFPLAHPRFPARPVTFRQLLIHTSGISDRRYEGIGRFTDARGRMPELEAFLRAYLVPHGALYRAGECWGDAPPGMRWSYSNVGFALLGHLVERLGGKPLDAVAQARLFAPLGMASTAWFVQALPAQRIATPYVFEHGRFRRLPTSLYPDWPAGSLRTTARDFARLLAVFQGDGSVDGRRYLRPDTLATMFTPQDVTVDPAEPRIRQGLAWVLRDVDGRTLASHSGGDPGTDAVTCLDRGAGTAMFCVANVSGGPALRALQKDIVLRELAAA
jgi:CubicO group peptidase (beta-lactamase class C family)